MGKVFYRLPLIRIGSALILLLVVFQNCSNSSFNVDLNNEEFILSSTANTNLSNSTTSNQGSFDNNSKPLSLRISLASNIFRFPYISEDKMGFQLSVVILNYSGESLGIEDFSALSRKYDLTSVAQDEYDKAKYNLIFRTDDVRKAWQEKPIYIQRIQKSTMKHGPFIVVCPRLNDPTVIDPELPDHFLSTQRIGNSNSMFRNKRVNVNSKAGLISIYEFLNSHNIKFIPLAAYYEISPGNLHIELFSHYLILQDSLSVRVFDLALERPQLIDENPLLKSCLLQGFFVRCTGNNTMYRVSEFGKLELFNGSTGLTKDVLSFPDSLVFLERERIVSESTVYLIKKWDNPDLILDSFTLKNNNCRGRWFDGSKIICTSDNSSSSPSVIYIKDMRVTTVQSNITSNNYTCTASIDVIDQTVMTQDFCLYGNIFQLGDQQTAPIWKGSINASKYYSGFKLWPEGYTLKIILGDFEYRSRDGTIFEKITPSGEEISYLQQQL